MNNQKIINKKNNIIYINVDDIDIYYQIYKDEIDKNREYYLSEIRKLPEIYNDYEKICDGIYELSNKRNIGLQSQIGGDAMTAGIVVGSFAVTGIVGFLLWYFLGTNACESKYPLYPKNKIPDIATILENLLPGKWIKDGISKGKSLEAVINETAESLDNLTQTFAVFDEQAGSTASKVLKSTTKIGLSVGAAVLTLGMGGDKIVNVPFFITKSINMTTKTFNKVSKVTTKITKTIKKISDSLKKVQNAVKKVVDTVEVIDKNKDELISSLRSNKQQIAFIYDLFNVDFSGGPAKCQCWVEYIMKYYISNNDRIKDIYMLLCIMNDIYLDINQAIIGFIGSALDMVIPESMGLAGTIAPLLEAFSYVIYRGIRNKIADDYYNNIPWNIQDMIQHPEKLYIFIDERFSSYTWGASDVVIPKSVKKYMKKGIDILAFGINKGMAMMFMFLNVFIIFSEINAGVNTTMINANIDVEKLLKDCAYCGQFNINGINPNGTLNTEDISNCKRCRRFYIRNDKQKVTDKVLYAKCMTYKDKRDQAKAAYQKLKTVAIKKYKKITKSKKGGYYLNQLTDNINTNFKYIDIGSNDSHNYKVDSLDVLEKIYDAHDDLLSQRIKFVKYDKINLSSEDKKYVIDNIY
jgi:hypothetical protein